MTNSQNTHDKLTTYLKIKPYDHQFVVLTLARTGQFWLRERTKGYF